MFGAEDVSLVCCRVNLKYWRYERYKEQKVWQKCELNVVIGEFQSTKRASHHLNWVTARKFSRMYYLASWWS